MSRRLVMSLCLFSVIGFTTMTGCASHSAVRKDFMADFNQGNYDAAEARLKEIGAKSKKNFLVDRADMGMVLNRAGKFEQSNMYLEQADEKLKEYFTTKVSDELAVIGWNESQGTYKGEDFERNMIDILQAMNYLAMGRYGDALIEAKQVDTKQADFVALLARNNIKTGFTADPFATYIAGLINEANAALEGQGSDQRLKALEDANANYVKALGYYQMLGTAYGITVPSRLAADIQSVKKQICNPSDMPADGVCDATGSRSEVIVITGVGSIVHKQSEKWIETDGQDNIVVTYPIFVTSPTVVAGSRVVGAGMTVSTVPVYDLSRIAVEVNKERNLAVRERAVKRAMALYLVKKAARAAAAIAASASKQAGGWAALVGGVVNLGVQIAEAVEVADTRSWMTLPDVYTMARIPVAAGVHDMKVEFVDASGAVVNTIPVKVNVVENGKSFVILHSCDAQKEFAVMNFGPKGDNAPVEAAPVPAQ